jgi:hypothetical protein
MSNSEMPSAKKIAEASRLKKANRKWFQKKRFIIPIALFVVSGISGVVNGAGNGTTSVARNLSLPDVAGSNASDAYTKLTDLGFANVDVQDASSEDRTVILKSNWQVCSLKPTAGAEVSVDSTVILLAVKNNEDCTQPDGNTKNTSDSSATNDSKTKTVSESPSPVTSKSAVSISKYGAQPDSESAAIAAISKYQTKYQNASNNLQQADIRLKRDDAVCKASGGSSIKSWTGIVKSIGGTSEGQGYLTVEVAEGVTLETWNNTLSDSSDHTLIPRNSPLYKTVLGLEEGDLVTFSGSFVPADGACLDTKNLTEVFAMYTPEFVFKFTAITTK